MTEIYEWFAWVERWRRVAVENEYQIAVGTHTEQSDCKKTRAKMDERVDFVDSKLKFHKVKGENPPTLSF